MLQSFGHIPQFSVISAIDILVVAFLIYEFLKLIKGTRAIPMLAAVILIVGAFWIAHIE
jgi:DNA integrity scanning protein DisA with diadenylate cyclase activity